MTDSRRVRLTVGIAALVVIVVASSSRQRLSLPLERSSVGHFLGDAGAIAFGVAGVIAIALIVLTAARLRRKKPEDERVDEQPYGRWARLAAALVALAIVAIPVVLIVAARHHGAGQTQAPPAVSPPSISGHSNAPTVSNAATPIAIGVLLAAVVAFVVVLWMWRRHVASAEIPKQTDVPTMTPDDVVVATALSGATALQDFRDPRQAILACYTAMRAALLRFGLPAREADTPTDFLLRVMKTGVATNSARELTALFHEARFSTHPMTTRHRRQAEDALHEIARSISGREHIGGDGS